MKNIIIKYKNFLRKYEPKNYLLKYLYRFITTLISIVVGYFLILYALLGIGIILFLPFRSPKPNPTERNYIVFPGKDVNEVIDSIYRFMEIIKKYPFPIDTNGAYSLVIDRLIEYENRKFKLNDSFVGDFTFSDLRRSKQFQEFKDEQIIDFLNLYKYLFNLGIDFGIYDTVWKNYFRFNYKDMYYMYDFVDFNDEFNRSLTFFDGKQYKTLPNRQIALDYYRGFQLTCNGEDTTSKNIPYKMMDKFRKK